MSPNDSGIIPSSIFVPLAPFLTRLLTIVVPSSPERTEIRSPQGEHSQLLNIILSLVLSLIVVSTRSSLTTLPLSSLLSVLSVALAPPSATSSDRKRLGSSAYIRPSDATSLSDFATATYAK
ncbi:hypothetical protein BLNAU_3168 [Blattamonas nauphoetae]|uniref:Uncharacterized protein n=1 Tax=Blattamonas nauphoetae TaxID=2049346 RepID=A0ABQ9YDL0_9EUKA|nr:hypothetical protein BLNAU_3168 [Blattamonas nauphoetae]